MLSALVVCPQLLPNPVQAGGGPENVLVVVNGDSAVSMQIANTYIEMREIPPEHVLWLHNIPYLDRISIDTFRKRIWQPIRDYLTGQQLDEEIDIIAYSAGFPFSVNFSTDLKTSKLPKSRVRGRKASLTALTYFARHVERGSTGYLAGNANRYFRRNLTPGRYLPRSLTDTEDHLLSEAIEAFRQKDFQAARTRYKSLTRSYPEHGRIWYELARSHAALGDMNEAMAALLQAVNHGWTNSLETRNDNHLKTLAADPAYQHLLERMEQNSESFQHAHGFSARYEWTGATRPVKTFGNDSLDSYYLSTMLAYTGLNGNSVPEVKNYLAAARSSDGTRPDGTVYLLVNDNVRSRTRQHQFQATVAALERRGHRAELLTQGSADQDGILPQGKEDVIGVVVGTAKFDWQASGSRLLPGAIAESLTSYGGRFNEHQQTKLTEFLRHGAAGSSGAVTEPFSIQAKFPVPQLHVHYADGASLAEAFYQSVASPYQLLVVGDPLARPYARFARVKLLSPDPDIPWSGVVTLRPAVEAAAGRPVGQLELWVDGQLTAYAGPDKTIRWDTRNLDDGYHEIRLVAQESGPIETRSYGRIGIMIANSDHRMEVNPPEERIYHGEIITISGLAMSGIETTIWQGNRKLATSPIKDGRWEARIASQQLGVGTVTLGVRVAFIDNKVVRSAPVKLEIAPLMPAGKGPDIHQPEQGPATTGTSHHGKEKSALNQDGSLRRYPDSRHLILEGQFTADRSGLYEFVLVGEGEASLTVDTLPLLSKEILEKKHTRFLPLALEMGTHTLKIEYSPAERKPHLKLMLQGDQVATIPELKVVRNDPGKTDANP